MTFLHLIMYIVYLRFFDCKNDILWDWMTLADLVSTFIHMNF